MAKTILVAGSLHYDVVVEADRMPQVDETLPGKSVHYVPGGKGRNQAVAAARNGAATFMAGRIGSDQAGEVLKSDLVARGVDISLLQAGQGEASGMSVAVVSPSGDYSAVIVSGSNLTFSTEESPLPADFSYLLLQNEILESANLAMARKARAAGASVLLNAAPARPLSDEFAQLVDILVANRIEAEALSGMTIASPRDAMDVAAKLCETIPTVVVTLGSDGVVHMRAGGRAEIQPAFKAKVVSSHGAGDYFIGALITQLASGSALEAAIHYAQAGAAIFVSTVPEERDAIRPLHIRARLGEDDR